MDTLIEIINFFILLCDAVAGVRLLYCLIRCISDPDEVSSYLKKIVNMLIFLVLANTCLASLVLVQGYFAV
jgi:hypothetical protein